MSGVLLLHGIGASSANMRFLELAARLDGYDTLNLTYPSRRQSLTEIANHIAPAVDTFAARAGQLHIITHSMGGLVARALIAQHRPANWGRVVMLAPPNRGSEVADRLQNAWVYRRVLGPAGQQLVTRRGGTASDIFGETDFDLGIIAGTRSIYPVPANVLPRPNDGLVSVNATRDARATDHLSLPISHPMMVLSPRIIHQCLTFLRDGRFDHQRKQAE